MLDNKMEMRSITDAGCKARQDRRSSHLEPKTGGKVLAFRHDGTMGRTGYMLDLQGRPSEHDATGKGKTGPRFAPSSSADEDEDAATNMQEYAHHTATTAD